MDYQFKLGEKALVNNPYSYWYGCIGQVIPSAGSSFIRLALSDIDDCSFHLEHLVPISSSATDSQVEAIKNIVTEKQVNKYNQ